MRSRNEMRTAEQQWREAYMWADAADKTERGSDLWHYYRKQARLCRITAKYLEQK